MTRWSRSVAFKLFAVTFAFVMLLVGGLLTVLAGSFSSFYERSQIRDITEDLNRIRDRFALDRKAGTPLDIPPYFYEFENEYYALTSILSFNGGRSRVVVGGGFQERLFVSEPGVIPSLPDKHKLTFRIAKPAALEQMEKLSAAAMEWRNDEAAVRRVMLDGETLVFRAKGIGLSERGAANQLVAVARVDGDAAGNGTVIFAVSSLQPISNAASVIRDYSYYAFGVAIVLALFLAFLYAKIVTKPLRSLNASARKLAQLDFSVRGDASRKDEIGELGRTFDFLAKNLQRTLGELHEANDKLKEDIERERRLERMRRDFIAGVSHELKTPLSLIGGYAEGLKDNIGSGEKRERYAEVILDETQRMSAIVADMLDLSQLESGQYVLQWEAFDAVDLLRESSERARSLGKSKDIQVRLHLDAAGEMEEVRVRGDRMRVGQVLTNLLSNAVRHAPEGGTVELALQVADRETHISVYNEGEPIPEEEMPRIWGQFYRTDKSRSRGSGGTGIGLAIVRQILQLHGSRFDVRNESGGVRFGFSLSREE